MTELFCILLMRTGQALIGSLPSLLAGCVLAGLLATCVPRGAIDRWLGRSGFFHLLLLRVVFLLLPLSSVGVIPLAIEARRRGASSGAFVLLLLSGATTPWTLAYGLERIDAGRFAIIIAATVLLTTLIAWIAGRLVRFTQPTESQNADGLPGTAHVAGRMARASLPFVLIGSILFGLMATLVPTTTLEHAVGERELHSQLLISALAIPAMPAAEMGMMHVTQIIEVGANPGAAVAWLIAGAGFSLATAALLMKTLCWWRGIVVTLMVWVCALNGSLLTDRVLFRSIADDPDTHAFDALVKPWHMGETTDRTPAGELGYQLRASLMPMWSVASPGLISLVGLLVLMAISLRRRSLAQAPASNAGWRMGIGVYLLLIAPAVAVYSFYPDPRTIVAEMKSISAELPVASDSSRAAHLQRLHRLTDRLRAASMVRRFGVPAGLSGEADVYRQSLDALAGATERRQLEVDSHKQLVRLGRLFNE
jgi:uncharacterized protein